MNHPILWKKHEFVEQCRLQKLNFYRKEISKHFTSVLCHLFKISNIFINCFLFSLKNVTQVEIKWYENNIESIKKAMNK